MTALGIFTEDQINLLRLNNVQEVSDLAALLNVPNGQMQYIAYKKGDKANYKTFLIPKKNGDFREINKPIKGLDIIHGKFREYLVSAYNPRPSAHGFIRGRSVLTNAQKHVKARYVLNLDLKNFYDSINFGRVRGLLMAPPIKMGDKAATVAAKLLTVDNKLPQGACTSPVISNLIASGLDKVMIRLAKKYKLIYTRYADDLTFSTRRKSFPRQLLRFKDDNPLAGDYIIGADLEDAVKNSGFEINYDKVRMQTRGVRQEVTGITVNEFPNVTRKFIRQIRAMIYAWQKFGLESAGDEYLEHYCKKDFGDAEIDSSAYYKEVIYGKLSYLKMIRGEQDALLAKYTSKVCNLDENPPKFLAKIMTMIEKYDVFIGHASEDKATTAEPIFDACAKLGIKAFLDKVDIAWGDSLTERVNHALSQSKFFLAIMSEKSTSKEWPKKELNSAISREIGKKQVVLPLIIGDFEKVLEEYPLIADKKHIVWDGDAD